MYETAKIVGERTLKIDQHLAKLVAEVYRLVAPFFRTRCRPYISVQFSSVGAMWTGLNTVRSVKSVRSDEQTETDQHEDTGNGSFTGSQLLMIAVRTA